MLDKHIDSTMLTGCMGGTNNREQDVLITRRSAGGVMVSKLVRRGNQSLVIEAINRSNTALTHHRRQENAP